MPKIRFNLFGPPANLADADLPIWYARLPEKWEVIGVWTQQDQESKVLARNAQPKIVSTPTVLVEFDPEAKLVFRKFIMLRLGGEYEFVDKPKHVATFINNISREVSMMYELPMTDEDLAEVAGR